MLRDGKIMHHHYFSKAFAYPGYKYLSDIKFLYNSHTILVKPVALGPTIRMSVTRQLQNILVCTVSKNLYQVVTEILSHTLQILHY